MLTLIIGGARSGKSRYAQALCGEARNVVFVATARAEEADEEMRARVSRHRAERPRQWGTIEEPLDLSRAVGEAAPPDAVLLVDCITVWVSNLMWEYRTLTDGERESLILARAAEFARGARERDVVAVTNEVGGGIVPDNEVGRAFRDLHGLVNQVIAGAAARVILIVAGLPFKLKDEQV